MMRRRPFSGRPTPLSNDPLWYKDAVIYELRVRSYNDSNGDGIGDFGGLTEKLDYLQDLGVTALWLLPFYPSPYRDDGYDISDYNDVHADVGTLEDFRGFLEEAHRRGLRVITELVLNHTSDQHPWFQRARRAPPGSPERDFYVWNESPEKYRDARIIFKDFEPSNWSWDPVARSYYWHRFFAHQPDLNFENPAVQEALLAAVDFWLALGVDGLRLDAVPYLYEEEGTNCENLPKTHVFLRKLRAHVDQRFQNRLLLAEANQWPEDAAAYFGSASAPECHMNFHFPIMPRIFMSIHMEDRLPLIDIFAQTPKLDEKCQWAIFLRNHDELTLEMVTDEERDYMYRAYAGDPAMRLNLGIRRRLAPLLGNDRRNIELMNALLFSLPGTPVLYYGDEIGMGDNVYLGDRNGVRTPMQWSTDRNAGFSRANPQRLILPVIIDPEYHYESLNVEAQQQNPSSLLWWTKRMIALRQRYQAFGRGTIEFLSPDNPKVLAFFRQYGDETLLIVANLSRNVQYAELDLSTKKGLVPVELLGRTHFPAIGELPYLLALGGHAFYWFALQKPDNAEGEAREAAYQPPAIKDTSKETLEEVMAGYLEGRRWFRGGGRQLVSAKISELLSMSASFQLAFLRVEYADGDPETYVIPLGEATDLALAAEILARAPQAVLATLPQGILYDPLADVGSARPVLEALAAHTRVKGANGELVASTARPLENPGALDPRVTKPEHPNAIVIYGNKYLLKFFRKLDEGTRPELEIGRFLTQRPGSPAPPLVGQLEYRPRRGEPITIATLHEFVPSEGDAFTYSQNELARFFERVLARHEEVAPSAPPGATPLQLADRDPPVLERDLIGGFLDPARLLGQRVAELHAALASAPDDPLFAPEPYSALDQRSSYQAMRNTTGSVLRLLKTRLAKLPPHAAELGRELCANEERVYRRFDAMLSNRVNAQRLRRHGDLKLGSVLYTCKDFVIIDFDGRRDRPLPERRRKRSPLRDVAGMLRSLQHAAMTALHDPALVREADRDVARPWAWSWYLWSAASFLRGYLATAHVHTWLARDQHELGVLLDAYLLDKSLRELGDDLEGRPGQAALSLEALTLMLA